MLPEILLRYALLTLRDLKLKPTVFNKAITRSCFDNQVLSINQLGLCTHYSYHELLSYKLERFGKMLAILYLNFSVLRYFIWVGCTFLKIIAKNTFSKTNVFAQEIYTETWKLLCYFCRYITLLGCLLMSSLLISFKISCKSDRCEKESSFLFDTRNHFLIIEILEWFLIAFSTGSEILGIL